MYTVTVHSKKIYKGLFDMMVLPHLVKIKAMVDKNGHTSIIDAQKGVVRVQSKSGWEDLWTVTDALKFIKKHK